MGLMDSNAESKFMDKVFKLRHPEKANRAIKTKAKKWQSKYTIGSFVAHSRIRVG